MPDITDKLRTEINDSKKIRHEFLMRKFSFVTVLLGAGSLRKLLDGDTVFSLDFAPLLFLVPIVAIAFDLIILSEDYRIKRAGEFLRARASDIDEDEREWENF